MKNWSNKLISLLIISLFIQMLYGCKTGVQPQTIKTPTAQIPSNIDTTPGYSQLTISWQSVETATSYNLYWATTIDVNKDYSNRIIHVVSPYTHAGLEIGKTYYYVVTAVNAGGESQQSNKVWGIPISVLSDAPSELDIIPGDSKVTISWQSTEGATSYNLYWATTPDVNRDYSNRIVNVTSPYIHIGLENGKTYYYVVTAVNADGESHQSNEVGSVPKSAWPFASSKITGLTSKGYRTVPVLSYHHFAEKLSEKETMITRDAFEAQMAFLKMNGYSVISMEQFFNFLEFKGSIPEKSLVITIDDGFESSYKIAFPILKKYSYPATLFINTEAMDAINPALTWQQLREMAEHDITIQCNTVTHRDLTEPNDNESFKDYFKAIKEELSIASRTCEEKLGNHSSYISYPYGNYNQLVIALLRKLGYRGGFTMKGGTNSLFVDHYKINRFLVMGNFDITQFQEHLTTFIKKEINDKNIYNNNVSPKLLTNFYEPYEVKEGDTLKIIAQNFYHDDKKQFLINFFNDVNENSEIKSGLILKLPVLGDVEEAASHFKKGRAYYGKEVFCKALQEYAITLSLYPYHEKVRREIKNTDFWIDQLSIVCN